MFRFQHLFSISVPFLPAPRLPSIYPFEFMSTRGGGGGRDAPSANIQLGSDAMFDPPGLFPRPRAHHPGKRSIKYLGARNRLHPAPGPPPLTSCPWKSLTRGRQQTTSPQPFPSPQPFFSLQPFPSPQLFSSQQPFERRWLNPMLVTRTP